MTKALVLGSVTFLALCGGATAASVTNITFNEFCDGMQIQTSDGKHFTSTQTGNCLQGVSITGISSTKRIVIGLGTVNLIVDWSVYDGHAPGTDLRSYQLQYPFKTGGSFKEWVYTSGKYVLLNNGTYTVQQ